MVKILRIIMCVFIASSTFGAQFMGKVGNHLRRYAAKYVGGAASAAFIVAAAEKTYPMASKKYDDARKALHKIIKEGPNHTAKFEANYDLWHHSYVQCSDLSCVAGRDLSKGLLHTHWRPVEAFKKGTIEYQQPDGTWVKKQTSHIDLKGNDLGYDVRFPYHSEAQARRPVAVWSTIMAASKPLTLVSQFQEKVQPRIRSAYAQVKASAIKAFDTWAKKNS